MFIEINKDLMIIKTKFDNMDMQKIKNRRFMYSPKSETLILGKQQPINILLASSHADELFYSGVKENYDNYIRGWIGGRCKSYRYGVIHFAPDIKATDKERFYQGVLALQMFLKNGLIDKTIIRGFGREIQFLKIRNLYL